MAHTWPWSSVMLWEGTCIHTYMSTPIYTYLTQQVLKPRNGQSLSLCSIGTCFLTTECHRILSCFLQGTRRTLSKPRQDPHCFDVGTEPWRLQGEVVEEKASHPKPQPSQLTADNFIFKNTWSHWPHCYSLTSSFLTSCLFTDVPSSSKSQ